MHGVDDEIDNETRSHWLQRIDHLRPRRFDDLAAARQAIPMGNAACSVLPQYLSEPLDVEIGCGVGLHPITRSKQQPERTLIAIEHTQSRFGKFAQRLKHHERPNLIPIHANAVSWLTHQLEENSVDELFMLYPNPNDKPKSRHKRFHQMLFFDVLCWLLKKGGKLHCASDRLEYLQEMAFFSEHLWGLHPTSIEQIDSSIKGRTHFERKYLPNKACYQLMLYKT